MSLSTFDAVSAEVLASLDDGLDKIAIKFTSPDGGEVVVTLSADSLPAFAAEIRLADRLSADIASVGRQKPFPSAVRKD